MPENITTRPWGTFEIITRGAGYLVKRLSVRHGQSTSLQFHNHRTEHLTIVEGEARITVDKETYRYAVDDVVSIPIRARHRIENIGMGSLTIIEVWTGMELDEADIVRIDDWYGRKGTTG